MLSFGVTPKYEGLKAKLGGTIYILICNIMQFAALVKEKVDNKSCLMKHLKHIITQLDSF